MAYIVKRGKRNPTFSVFYYSYTPDGTKTRESITGIQSEEAAKMKKEEIENEERMKKRIIFQPNITVEKFMDVFIKNISKDHWKPKTYTGNVSLIRTHIIPNIGDIKIRDLVTQDIINMLDRLKETPTNQNNKYRTAGKPLSSTTRMHVFNLLKDAMNCAVEWKYIKESPMPSDKMKPGRSKPLHPFWTKNTVLEALEDISDPLLHLAIHLAFWSSCRPGEILGITEDCIDLKNRTLLINKTLSRVSKEALRECGDDDVYYVFPEKVADSKTVLILGSLKVDGTERIVHMSKSLAAEVAHVLMRNDQRRKIYDDYQDPGMLFALDHGEPVEVTLIAKWFRKFIKRSEGVYPSIPFKNFRHSSATYKYGLDQNLTTVSATTGHKNPTVLLNTYAQTLDRNVLLLADKMEADLYVKDEEISEDTASNAMEIIEKAMQDEMLRNQLIAALLAGNATRANNARM